MAPVCVRAAFIGGGSGGTFALGRTTWGASRCATEVRNDGKIIQTERTRGTTPWALRPSPPAHRPPPATRLREAKAFPNHIAARVAP